MDTARSRLPESALGGFIALMSENTESSALEWDLGDHARTRPFADEDVEAMHRLLTAGREHLDRWLRWSSALVSPSDVRAFVDDFAKKRAAGDGFHSGIWLEGALVGGVVCWYVHPRNRNAEIGYWLSRGALGRGLATRAAAKATDHLFSRGLHRIEMQCAVDNTASRAIPEKLGYRLEGIRRESHFITSRFLDHAVYGLLAREWNGLPR